MKDDKRNNEYYAFCKYYMTPGGSEVEYTFYNEELKVNGEIMDSVSIEDALKSIKQRKTE